MLGLCVATCALTRLPWWVLPRGDSVASPWPLGAVKQWERAAIVYAFTTSGCKGGRPENLSEMGQVSFPVSISAFGRLGSFFFYIASNTYVSAFFVRGRLWRLLLC